jgi:hypothetical protein
MNTVAELEKAIEGLPRNEFEILAAWVEERSRALKSPIDSIPSGRKKMLPTRDHAAFLNSYAPEDEGLYDDAATG